MSGGHAHGRAGQRHRWRLAVTFGLIASFFVVELVAGLASGSLALLSDAGHMAADVVTLAAALAATHLAARPDRTGRRTYGSYRAEVFASALAVLVMLAVAAFVLVEGASRAGGADRPATGAMLVVGALGLVVNVTALVLLRAGARESLNVRGAYLEVAADTAGSVGVIAAAVLVTTTGRTWWDTVVAVVIAVFVAVRAVRLGREVLAVLAQHVPAGLDAAAVGADLRGVRGVVDVHDLHLWTLTSGMNVATAHLVTAAGAAAEEVLTAAREVLRERHGIAHATVQVESQADAACEEVDW